MFQSSQFDGIRDFGVHGVSGDYDGSVTTQERLQEVVDTLRRVGWSFKQFLLAWVGERAGSQDILLEHRQYRTMQQRRELLLGTVADLNKSHSVVDEIVHEFDCLIKQPYFNQFDRSIDFDTLDFSLAFRIMEETAPTWHAMVLRLISNQRTHRLSYTGNTNSLAVTLSKRLFAITSMICHSRAKQQSNVLSSMLAVYLVGSGVKRRVIEVLSGLGICYSYHQANRLMRKVAHDSAA
jgi:hypothetical protein